MKAICAEKRLHTYLSHSKGGGVGSQVGIAVAVTVAVIVTVVGRPTTHQYPVSKGCVLTGESSSARDTWL